MLFRSGLWIMRLCFGTFVKTLYHCRIKKVSQPELVAAVVECVDPISRYVTDSDTQNGKSTANHLIFCDYEFVFSDGASESSFPSEIVIENTKSGVLPLIREDMYAKMLLALLDIIRKDVTIDSEHKEDFKKFFGVSKGDLLQKTSFNLPTFLGEMLLYTTCCNIGNMAGKPFVKEITIKHIENIEKNSWGESKYISKTQTVEFILTEERRLKEEIDALSELRLSVMDSSENRTGLEWLGINQFELFPSMCKPVELRDPKTRKEISAKFLQYIKIINKFMTALASGNDLDRNEQLKYPILPSEELKVLRQQLNNLYNEICSLAMFPNLFVSDKSDIED